MGTVAAGIETKVTPGALDRARGNGRLASGSQGPGVWHLCPAKGATEAVGAVKSEVCCCILEEICPLRSRHKFDALAPPVAIRGDGAQ